MSNTTIAVDHPQPTQWNDLSIEARSYHSDYTVHINPTVGLIRKGRSKDDMVDYVKRYATALRLKLNDYLSGFFHEIESKDMDTSRLEHALGLACRTGDWNRLRDASCIISIAVAEDDKGYDRDRATLELEDCLTRACKEIPNELGSIDELVPIAADPSATVEVTKPSQKSEEQSQENSFRRWF